MLRARPAPQTLAVSGAIHFTMSPLRKCAAPDLHIGGSMTAMKSRQGMPRAHLKTVPLTSILGTRNRLYTAVSKQHEYSTWCGKPLISMHRHCAYML